MFACIISECDEVDSNNLTFHTVDYIVKLFLLNSVSDKLIYITGYRCIPLTDRRPQHPPICGEIMQPFSWDTPHPTPLNPTRQGPNWRCLSEWCFHITAESLEWTKTGYIINQSNPKAYISLVSKMDHGLVDNVMWSDWIYTISQM